MGHQVLTCDQYPLYQSLSYPPSIFYLTLPNIGLNCISGQQILFTLGKLLKHTKILMTYNIVKSITSFQG